MYLAIGPINLYNSGASTGLSLGVTSSQHRINLAFIKESIHEWYILFVLIHLSAETINPSPAKPRREKYSSPSL